MLIQNAEMQRRESVRFDLGLQARKLLQNKLDRAKKRVDVAIAGNQLEAIKIVKANSLFLVLLRGYVQNVEALRVFQGRVKVGLRQQQP